MRWAAALIFTTSSHFFSLCQQHCESVSHSYAATDGPIPLLQPSRRHDSWGSVSWFRVSFIFLLTHSRGAFLYDSPEAMTLVCLACLRGGGSAGQNPHTHIHINMCVLYIMCTCMAIWACIGKGKGVKVSSSFSQTLKEPYGQQQKYKSESSRQS